MSKIKKHKFKLDQEHWNENHRTLFDFRSLFYIAKCKICGNLSFDSFENHLSETFKIPKISEILSK